MRCSVSHLKFLSTKKRISEYHITQREKSNEVWEGGGEIKRTSKDQGTVCAFYFYFLTVNLVIQCIATNIYYIFILCKYGVGAQE